MYTYDVQYAEFDWNQVKEMGSIDVAGAIKAFSTFPFIEEYEKANSLPEGTAPTISFRSQSDKAILSIWLMEPGLYEVYMEDKGKKVTVETSNEQFITETIESFFGNSRSDLFKQLANQPGAVIKVEFLKWVLSLFLGK